jgi:beta-phosphoglucomutase-like phosphatase (HAD superfamily)
MKSQRQTNLRGHGPISWETHLRIWERYAKRYGKSQSTERIEERYGFDMSEADMLYPEWREDEDLRDQLATAQEDTARVVDAVKEAISLTSELYTGPDTHKGRITLLNVQRANAALRVAIADERRVG